MSKLDDLFSKLKEFHEKRLLVMKEIEQLEDKLEELFNRMDQVQEEIELEKNNERNSNRLLL